MSLNTMRLRRKTKVLCKTNAEYFFDDIFGLQLASINRLFSLANTNTFYQKMVDDRYSIYLWLKLLSRS